MNKSALAILSAAIAITAGCASTSSGASPRLHTAEAITGKLWQWEETVTPIARVRSAAPQHYTLQLQADGRAAVRFDCNRGNGSYKISKPGHISFGPMATTMMACLPDSQDRDYAKDLGRASTFFVEGGQLYLELPADSGTMRFSAAD